MCINGYGKCDNTNTRMYDIFSSNIYIINELNKNNCKLRHATFISSYISCILISKVCNYSILAISLSLSLSLSLSVSLYLRQGPPHHLKNQCSPFHHCGSHVSHPRSKISSFH